MSVQESLSIEQLLSHACATVPNEDPLKYFNAMYSSVNPMMVQEAVRMARHELVKENKKNGKPANVFMTIGGDGCDRTLYEGAIGTMLWLPEYLTQTHEHFGVTDTELETALKVLRACKLPQAFDAKFDETENKLSESSTCRHYAACLSSFVAWLTTGCNSVKTTGKVKSNFELVRFLTGMALNSFPSIPYTAWFIGAIKTTDPMELAEKMSRVIDFNKFMTPESVTINQPRFIVQNESAPLVGMVGHPLANTLIGQVNNNGNNVEWLGLFTQSEEFEKICVKSGLTAKDVKKYMFMTSEAEHAKNMEKNHPVAKFVEAQHFTKNLFALRNKIFSVYDDEKLEGEYVI